MDASTVVIGCKCSVVSGCKHFRKWMQALPLRKLHGCKHCPFSYFVVENGDHLAGSGKRCLLFLLVSVAHSQTNSLEEIEELMKVLGSHIEGGGAMGQMIFPL